MSLSRPRIWSLTASDRERMTESATGRGIGNWCDGSPLHVGKKKSCKSYYCIVVIGLRRGGRGGGASPVTGNIKD